MAKKKIEKIGETNSRDRVVLCQRCAGPARKKHVRMEATSTMPMFTWYRCPECKDTIKIARQKSEILMVKGDPNTSLRKNESEPVENDSESAR